MSRNPQLKLANENLEQRRMLSAVQVFAAGDTGQETFELQVRGETVATFEVDQQISEYSVQVDPSVTADDIRIVFNSDVWDPDNGIDANLIVDKIKVHGEVFETEDASVYSTGTWTPQYGVSPGYHQSEYLNSNGYFQYKDDAPSASSQIVIHANGYEGGEEFTLRVNGQEIQSFSVGTTPEVLTVDVATADIQEVEIEFTNDTWDPSQGIDSNLKIDKIVVNGSEIQTESGDVYSTGTWHDGGIVPGYGRGDTLHTNGKFVFTLGDTGNTDPVGVKDKFYTDYQTAVQGNVLSNDSDADGDSLIASLGSGPANGNVVLYSNGDFEYTPDAGFSGDDVFYYFVNDGNGGTDWVEVCVEVAEAPNMAPVGEKDKFYTSYQTAVTGNVLTNDSDADGDTLTVTLQSGPSNGTVVLNSNGDFEYTPDPGFSGDDIFHYTVSDGEGGTDVVEVCIQVAPQPANSSLGDRVWLDSNRNGLQDNGELGIADVTVQLKDENGNVIATTQTDANGDYLFDDLTAGDYSVAVVAPTGLEFTTVDALGEGADGVDSDIDPTTGMTQVVTLGENEQNLTLDAGLQIIANSSIGDRVFIDFDSDGIQDPEDAGVEGIVVQLKDENGNVLETTVTDANGDYLFDNLIAGNYIVGIQEVPDGLKVTEANQGDDDAADSDVNPDTLMTDVVELGVDEDITDVDVGLKQFAKVITEAGGVHHANVIEDRAHGTYQWFFSYARNNGLTNGVAVLRYAFNHELFFGNADITNVTYEIVDLPELVGGRFWDEPSFSHDLKDNVYTDTKGSFFNFSIGRLDLTTNELDGKDLTVRFQYEDAGVIKTKTVTICLTYPQLSLQHGSPIGLDLNGDGEIGVTGETSSVMKDADAEIGRTVEFDLDADGALDTIEWFDGSGDGILVDTSKIGADGSIDGSALFGDQGGQYQNGYEKLATKDANGDGVIAGEELQGLALWLDDGDAVLEEEELQSLADHNVVEISASMQLNEDAEGRLLMQSNATLANGDEILSEDVWFDGQ